MSQSTLSQVKDALALAMARHRSGDLAAAEQLYREIIAEEPTTAEAQHLLGVVLYQTGRHEDAVLHIQLATAQDDLNAEFFSNLSLPLRELKRHEEALAAASRAVEIRPDYAEAHANRGLVLMELRQYQAAATCFEQAITLKPQQAAFQNNLGNALRALRRFDGAEAAYRRAVVLRPGHAQALFGLGAALKELDRREEALATLREVISLDDGFADAHALIAGVLNTIGLPEDSARSARRALELDPDNYHALKAYAFNQNYLEESTREVVLAGARAFSSKLIDRAGEPAPHANSPLPDRRLRVGFVSGDLGQHPVGEFTRGVLMQIDHAQIELFSYCTKRRAHPMLEAFDVWHYVDGLSDGEIASSIRKDGIDVLVDLAGYSSGSRPDVFAAKPAPIQVSWLGYSATTGNPRIDYILVDRHIVPTNEEQFYTEKPWRLSDSYLCWTEPDPKVDVGPLPAMTNGAVTFGCFNNVRKIGPTTAKTWARVLAAVSDSRLVLKGSGRMNPVAYSRIADMLTAEGVDPTRLEFIGRVPDKTDHYKHYNRVDIALDPFPYVGTTTTVEALWMGVPVVTLAGDRFLSRVGESILTTLGAPEWIAADTEDYVRIAATLAADAHTLAGIRAGLRSRLLSSPLCDARRFARNLEDAFRGMWRAWCEQQSA